MNWIRRLSTHSNPLGLPTKIPTPPPTPRTLRSVPIPKHIPNVSKILLVASGKGGVGKSTTAVNVAVGLALLGKKVGLLDADLYGPSIPKMMHLDSMPRLNPKGQLVPLQNHGIECMSIGFLMKSDAPLVWRGLMVMKAIEQLIWQTDWNVDILVVDMPPGTGDIQLTISQQCIIDGALIISTPQDVALADAIKAIQMFKTVKVPILGMVQNMSLFTCPCCGTDSFVFGKERSGLQTELGIEILAHVPLDGSVCETSDAGTPIVLKSETRHAQTYLSLARSILSKLYPS